ncbi:UNVERIFIED_CONTAM: hypothetical protein GTU68_010901 [Idotea baltica]|nr:hypothetical protein [Idotea baltica]
MALNLSPTLKLACELIKYPSITPDDAGCQEILISHLKKTGFSINKRPVNQVNNLWATHGTEGPTFCFAGHTDVVSTGSLKEWEYPPFSAIIDSNGMLHGRGAADMKGSLAAMITASTDFVTDFPQHKGRLAFLITSDEEGPAVDGTQAVIKLLKRQNESIDWCVIGEPSSVNKLGDTIKNGRRGSLTGNLIIKGKQGHIAYPHLANNPIHLSTPALTELINSHWDNGNDFFPPTSFQIASLSAGTGATNIIPGELHVQFNFRFSTQSSIEQLQQRVIALLDRHQLNYKIDWTLFGLPFLTEQGDLLNAASRSVQSITGSLPHLSTSGGTSDGRFISTIGAQVIELGPINATIHQINEQVSTHDLNLLHRIYYQILCELLT